MAVTQLSVVIENAPGKAAEVLNSLARAKINVRAASISENTEFGIMRLVVRDVSRAKQVLKKKGFTTSADPVLAVILKDRPGALAKMLAPLKKKNVNVEYFYASTCACCADECESTIILRAKNVKAAQTALTTAGYKLARP